MLVRVAPHLWRPNHKANHMKIGIIGSGYIGSTLSRGLSKAGHEIVIANSRGPDSIRDDAASWGAEAVELADVVNGVDVLVIAIQQGRIVDLPKDLFAALPETATVIDAGNYYPARDGKIAALEAGQVESAWVAEQIGHPVVKAFNSITFMSLGARGNPADAAERIGLPVSGDAAGKAIASKLVGDMGFDAVDNGAIADSWRQQPGSPVYCTDRSADQVKAGLARADKASLPGKRDASMDEMAKRQPGEAQQDVLSMFRRIYEA